MFGLIFNAENDSNLQEVLNLSELTEQIDTLRDNMSFIQDNVSECQNSIVHMEEFKVDELLILSLVSQLILYGVAKSEATLFDWLLTSLKASIW